jgi:hypothetical protein
MFEAGEFKQFSRDIGTFEVLVLAPSEQALHVLRHVKSVVNLHFGPVISVIGLVYDHGLVTV